jgi:hypothetical protein
MLQRCNALYRYNVMLLLLLLLENGIVRVRLYGSNRTVQSMYRGFFFGEV